MKVMRDIIHSLLLEVLISGCPGSVELPSWGTSGQINVELSYFGKSTFEEEDKFTLST